MFTTGFSMESAALAEPVEGPTAAWMSEQAQRLGAVVTGSLIVRDAAGQHRNRLLWATPDGRLQHYDKRHLFRMAVAAVNRIGSDGNGHPYAGDSQVLDFQGEPLIDAGAESGIFHTTLSAAALTAYRERFPAQRDADAFRLD